MTTSFFQQVPQAPVDVNFGLALAFLADERPFKIDLGIGIYKDEQLRSRLLPSVRQAKQEIFSEDCAVEYLPIDGSGSFCESIGELLFGKSLWQSHREKISSAQTVGGTAALRILAEFMAQEVTKSIYIPEPTWPNHSLIYQRAGCVLQPYPGYLNKEFPSSRVFSLLDQLPAKTAVLFHASCHNPTGCDPSPEDWKQIAELVHKRHLLPVFDFAYQGFGDGLEQDAEAIRFFVQQGLECCIAYSCSKNFSLYNQRVGALFVVNGDATGAKRISSQVKRIIRALYSNPPAHGARIVTHILKGPLQTQWRKEVTQMRERIQLMRKSFVEELEAKGRESRYMLNQKGMFSLLGLQPEQLKKLVSDYAIYMPEQGRVNFAGLNQEIIEIVTNALISIEK